MRPSTWLACRTTLWLLAFTLALWLSFHLQTADISVAKRGFSETLYHQLDSTSLHDCEKQHRFGSLNAASVLDRYFPQSRHCGDGRWRQEYADLHHGIVSGLTPPRYLTSVAVQSGLSDGITGLVTQFYLALLSKRAFTMVTYGDLPPFESACAAPYLNFTHPSRFSEEVLGPVKTLWQGPRAYPESGPVNSSMYHILYLSNQHEKTLDIFKHSNLSGYPPTNPDIPYVLSSSNRGQTHYLMHNPYHKSELASYGLRPETAFMCGWFSICAPNTAVQVLYGKQWETLSQPGVLQIGIQARLGDGVFTKQDSNLGASLLAVAAPYFECTEKLEKAFAVPGQKVVWYLISDALPLRVAAKQKYRDKLLTDTTTVTQHVDCQTFNPDSCSKEAMDLSMQHSIGQLLAFSLADYHITATESGFGRMGAWMSGKFGNLFEFDVIEKYGVPPPNITVACDPHRPTTSAFSSRTWAQVR